MFFKGDDDDASSSWRASCERRRREKEDEENLAPPGTRPKTEVDVIREWFVNIFQPVEKTADLVVTDFKFEQLDGKGRKKNENNNRPTPSAPPLSDGNGNGSTTTTEEEEIAASFRVLKKADVDLKVGGKPKQYSVIIKVLPTDDPERHTDQTKFQELLKFSKEVQVYANVIRSMAIFDEKRYPSACVEPPVPKCFLSQLDAQNDVLVLENLEFSGYRTYDKDNHLADFDHCRVALRRLAHFHAISTLIQRDSEQSLVDLYPFAVDAVIFKQRFESCVARPVREELAKYLMHEGRRGYGADGLDTDEKAVEAINAHLQDLFWKLVELRAKPDDRRLGVLIHGNLEPQNIVFQYDETSGRPICAKFLDFSALTVSSPVVDISYFLNRAVSPSISATHQAALLQHYHRAHTEAVESFGMHGFDLELDTLLTEYQSKQDYGAMMGCLLQPTLYVLQCLNRERNNKTKNGKTNPTSESERSKSESGAEEEDSTEDEIPKFEETVPTERLRIDRELVPVDLRLHTHLCELARSCPCPCAVGIGSKELGVSELSADSLGDLRALANKERQGSGLKTLDCGNGSTSTLKKLFLGFINTKESNNAATAGESGNNVNGTNGNCHKKT